MNNDDMVPSSDENQIIPVVNFDPVQHYLDELEVKYEQEDKLKLVSCS